MKSKVTISIVSLITILLLINCGGGSSLKDNKYLGKYPSLLKQSYKEAMDTKKKIQVAMKNEDMEKYKELATKAQQMAQKHKEKIDKYLKENPLKNKELPFEPLENTPYTIKKVKIREASVDGLGLNFPVKVNEDIKGQYSLKKHLNIYFKAIDTEGNVIKGRKKIARNALNETLKAGKTLDNVNTFYKDMDVKDFEDFATFVEITKEEYNK